MSGGVVNIEYGDKCCLEMLPFSQWGKNQKRGKVIRLKKTPIEGALTQRFDRPIASGHQLAIPGKFQKATIDKWHPLKHSRIADLNKHFLRRIEKKKKKQECQCSQPVLPGTSKFRRSKKGSQSKKQKKNKKNLRGAVNFKT